MSVKAIFFATNIVEIYKKEDYAYPLSPQRLQRLMFLFHLHYLKEFNKHFFEDEFEAFKLGGVVREVYSKYRIYFKVIDKPATYLDVADNGSYHYVEYAPVDITDKDLNFLHRLLQNYNANDEWQLADKCIDLLSKEGIMPGSLISKRQLFNMSNHINKI